MRRSAARSVLALALATLALATASPALASAATSPEAVSPDTDRHLFLHVNDTRYSGTSEYDSPYGHGDGQGSDALVVVDAHLRSCIDVYVRAAGEKGYQDGYEVNTCR